MPHFEYSSFNGHTRRFFHEKSSFTIRKKKHAKHPQIIVFVDRTSFKSMTLTHSSGRRKSKNILLNTNPNPNDDLKSYVSKQIIEDFKFNYSKAFQNYTLSNEDIDELIRFLESKKK